VNELLIDTHCHLYEEVFAPDSDAMIARAIEAGVTKMIIQNVDESTIQGMLDLEKKFPANCYATMGLHPCSVTANYEQELAIVTNWWAKRNFLAVGETGLDYYWDTTLKAEQQIVFRHQLKLAKQYQVPVIIHSRNSFVDCLRLVEEEQDGTLKGVFHCFSEGLPEAKAAIASGMYIGIGGTLTYKKSELVNVIPHIPLSSIVLETDAPYLPPVPYRGKRNESSYVSLVADSLANLLGVSYSEIANSTSSNAKRLFNLQ
jgi:TatD DNase family protein